MQTTERSPSAQESLEGRRSPTLHACSVLGRVLSEFVDASVRVVLKDIAAWMVSVRNGKTARTSVRWGWSQLTSSSVSKSHAESCSKQMPTAGGGMLASTDGPMGRCASRSPRAEASLGRAELACLIAQSPFDRATTCSTPQVLDIGGLVAQIAT